MGKGDMDDPRGGVRGVIPEMQSYWKKGLYGVTNMLQTKNKVFRTNNLQTRYDWMGVVFLHISHLFIRIIKLHKSYPSQNQPLILKRNFLTVTQKVTQNCDYWKP